MQEEEKKLVKIVLASGQVTHLFADEDSITQIFVQKSFVELHNAEKDGDLVFIDTDAIKMFEVFSDSRKKEIETATKDSSQSRQDEPA